MFDRRLACPRQFTALIPERVSREWIPRSTQIIPIEMIAPVLALSTFSDRLEGADLIVSNRL